MDRPSVFAAVALTTVWQPVSAGDLCFQSLHLHILLGLQMGPSVTVAAQPWWQCCMHRRVQVFMLINYASLLVCRGQSTSSLLATAAAAAAAVHVWCFFPSRRYRDFTFNPVSYPASELAAFVDR